MAPKIGFEPMTNWLTANCSTTELLRKLVIYLPLYVNILFSSRQEKILHR